MNEVYIEFEGTDREGAVAVGTYLIDAAKRLGFDLECDCSLEEPSAHCSVKVLKGTPLLSPPTAFETEHLSDADRIDRQRLACQARIEKPGEIRLMTVKKESKEEKTAKEESKAEEFKEEFRELPLREKFSSLVELELMALGDTLSFVMNSPYEAAGKVMDVMAEFGLDLEKKDREAKVPDEHIKPDPDKKEGDDDSKKSSATAGKAKPSKPSTAKRPSRRRKVTKKDEEDKG